MQHSAQGSDIDGTYERVLLRSTLSFINLARVAEIKANCQRARIFRRNPHEYLLSPAQLLSSPNTRTKWRLSSVEPRLCDRLLSLNSSDLPLQTVLLWHSFSSDGSDPASAVQGVQTTGSRDSHLDLGFRAHRTRGNGKGCRMFI
ncbi:hypothetical protein RRG08_052282 [Elysia crispata]|uniref:Uncharacterized protein n=1 Tax=Elysia crispata TaxID=231223 RepID=A0AAE0ZZ44_9GAST|nr:hypothetical protein RRG08_052282 [Elysia crispata]